MHTGTWFIYSQPVLQQVLAGQEKNDRRWWTQDRLTRCSLTWMLFLTTSFQTAAHAAWQENVTHSEESALNSLLHTKAHRCPWLAAVNVIDTEQRVIPSFLLRLQAIVLSWSLLVQRMAGVWTHELRRISVCCQFVEYEVEVQIRSTVDLYLEETCFVALPQTQTS